MGRGPRFAAPQIPTVAVMASKSKTDEIRVFFAWQSDLPAKFTRNAIRGALGAAVTRIANDEEGPAYGKTIVPDEATRDVPGSPNIPEEIKKKILASDIFVADVSIVKNRSEEPGEGMPNSNVVFELGFAAATLGWERIILLLNETYGNVRSLPFDFDRNRATPYTLSESAGTRTDLTKKVLEALSLIIRKDPKRPSADKFNVEEAQRQRDITNLRWLLGSLHWPTIDHYIRSGPEYITHQSDDFFEEARDILSSPLFHIYDRVAAEKIKTFFTRWVNSGRFDHYTPSVHTHLYKFTWSHSYREREREKKHWDYMQAERLKMHVAMLELLDVIREKYPEIDLQEECDAAGRRYDEQVEADRKRFEQLLPRNRGTKARSNGTGRKKGPAIKKSAPKTSAKS